MPASPFPSAGREGARDADALVLYGITGDLAKKMLLPALYRLTERDLLDLPVLGVARDDWDDARLRRHAEESVRAAAPDFDPQVFDRLARRLSYIGGDFTDDRLYGRIGAALPDGGFASHYLAVPPPLFLTVAAGLGAAGLNRDSRLVVEKPFGRDLASAQQLEADLERHFDREHLFRVDHFLGDESVESLVTFRFSNTLLGAIWDREHIENVQINLLEDFDVADRGSFYDGVGCLRDVVENHLFQVMALLAMDPPNVGDAQAQALEKWRVLHAVRTADPADVVRGQYEGYRDVEGVAPGSDTETYLAVKLWIDNWRWAGVPFCIRSGKALGTTATEVVVQLRKPPRELFRGLPHDLPADRIRIRLDPGAGIAFDLMARKPQPGEPPVSIPIGIDFEQALGREIKPYENILHAATTGDGTAFAYYPTIVESWRIVEKILDPAEPPVRYARGSEGPAEADALPGPGGWYRPAAHLFDQLPGEPGAAPPC